MRIIKQPSLLLLLLALLCINLSQQLTFDGNMIKDLEANNATFATEAAYWKAFTWSPFATATSASTEITVPLWSQCGTQYLLGGSSVMTTDGTFTRKYKNLPPHEIIYYSVELTLMNKWRSSSSVILLFDQDSYGTGLFLMDNADFPPFDACGDGDSDLPGITLYGKARHIEKTLNFRVVGVYHDTDPKSFGFRNLKLLLRNKTDDEEETQMCAISSTALHLGGCACPVGKYEEPLGSLNCEFCDPLCETCLGNLTSQCLTCKSNAFFNGTDCVQCHSSCKTCNGPFETNCTTCQSTDFLFTSGACTGTCNLPLISVTGPPLECQYNCPQDQYLYTNGSCEATCPFVFNSYTQYERKFCYDFCPTGKYYVPPAASATTGTCVPSTCPPGYFQDDVPRYCHTCQDPLCEDCPNNYGSTCQSCKTGAVLDTDGICKECTSMDFSYIKATSSGFQYQMQLAPSGCALSASTVSSLMAGTTPSNANFPQFTLQALSSNPNTYLVILILQGSVLQVTTMGVTLSHLYGELQVPKSLVPSPILETIGTYAPVAETVVGSVVGASFAGTMALGATASLWSIISFQQFIGYFKYINIEFPYQMEIFFNLLKMASWDFLPNPLASITSSVSKDAAGSNGLIEEYQSPPKFADDDINSFFIENAGGIFTLNLGLLLLLVLIKYLKKTKRFRRSSVLKTVKTFLKWNIIGRTFLENGIPLMLGVFLQLRYLRFNQVYLVFCSLFALASFAYFIVFTTFLTRAVHKRNTEQLEKEPVRKMFGTLYEGIALKDNASKYYHMIILFRGVLLVALVSFFDEIPIMQIALLIPFNAGLIYFLFKHTVFEDRYLNVVNKIKEVLILFGEGGILCLNFKSTSETYYDTLGWLIATCFAVGMLVELVYTIAMQIYNLRLIKKKAMEFWGVITRGISNLKARRRQRKQRIRRIQPQNIKLEMSSMQTADESGVDLSRILKLGQPLKANMLVRPYHPSNSLKEQLQQQESSIQTIPTIHL